MPYYYLQHVFTFRDICPALSNWASVFASFKSRVVLLELSGFICSIWILSKTIAKITYPGSSLSRQDCQPAFVYAGPLTGYLDRHHGIDLLADHAHCTYILGNVTNHQLCRPNLFNASHSFFGRIFFGHTPYYATSIDIEVRASISCVHGLCT